MTRAVRHTRQWYLLLFFFLCPCNLSGFYIWNKPPGTRNHASSSGSTTSEHHQQESTSSSIHQPTTPDTSTSITLKKTIGIDYGLARTGIAMSGGYAAAQPLQILDDPDTLIDEITKIMQLYGVEQIVLGWPLEKNGTVADQALVTREFGTMLKERVCRCMGNIPLYLCDERYTSKAARATLANSNESIERVDAVAACMILDSFFGGEEVSELILPDNVLMDCLHEYTERKVTAEAKQKAAIENREIQRQRRREAMARDQQLRAESGESKKKKKKKRKR